MYNTNDIETLSVANAVKQVMEGKEDFKPHKMYDPKTGEEFEAKTLEDHLKMKKMGYTHEKPSAKNETEIAPADQAAHDDHVVDKKKNPESEKQTEEKEVEDEDEDEVEEGNEFTAAAAKAKLAGEDKFDFEGKSYPVEIEQDAAEKILGKKESVELQEAANFGDIEKVMKWAKKNLSGAKLDISKKYGTAFINLTIFNIIILRLGGKKGIVVTHDDRTNGKGKDYEEHFSSANDVIKFVQKIYDEMPKEESVEENIEEAMKPAEFVKGGDTKITEREVEGMLSKIFINNKLAKQVEDSEAYQGGEKDKGKKKNPYKKDTADFHLYELGVQSSQAS